MTAAPVNPAKYETSVSILGGVLTRDFRGLSVREVMITDGDYNYYASGYYTLMFSPVFKVETELCLYQLVRSLDCHGNSAFSLVYELMAGLVHAKFPKRLRSVVFVIHGPEIKIYYVINGPRTEVHDTA